MTRVGSKRSSHIELLWSLWGQWGQEASKGRSSYCGKVAVQSYWPQKVDRIKPKCKTHKALGLLAPAGTWPMYKIHRNNAKMSLWQQNIFECHMFVMSYGRSEMRTGLWLPLMWAHSNWKGRVKVISLIFFRWSRGHRMLFLEGDLCHWEYRKH